MSDEDEPRGFAARPKLPRSPEEEEARSALRAAISAWQRCGGSWFSRPNEEPDPLALAMTQALMGLERAALEHDTEALNQKGGPVRWTRAMDPLTAFSYERRSEAARDLISSVESVLVRRGARSGEGLSDGAIGELVRGASARFLARSVSGLVPPPSLPLDQHEARMAEAVRARVQNGRRYDAKALAIALLMGWGLSRDEARNALKDKDA